MLSVNSRDGLAMSQEYWVRGCVYLCSYEFKWEGKVSKRLSTILKVPRVSATWLVEIWLIRDKAMKPQQPWTCFCFWNTKQLHLIVVCFLITFPSSNLPIVVTTIFSAIKSRSNSILIAILGIRGYNSNELIMNNFSISTAFEYKPCASGMVPIVAISANFIYMIVKFSFSASSGLHPNVLDRNFVNCSWQLFTSSLAHCSSVYPEYHGYIPIDRTNSIM